MITGFCALQAFLQARIDGEGAEEYVDVHQEFARDEIPFLHNTPTGAPYERSEFEVVEGPLWPDGQMRFKVRLFAQNGQTVVEQFFQMDRVDRGLSYEDQTEGSDGSDMPGTTVNGQAVPVPYSLFDGEVTLYMTYPWRAEYSDDEGSRFNLINFPPFSGTSSRERSAAGPRSGQERLPTGPGSGRRPGTGPEHPIQPRFRSHRSGDGERRRDPGPADGRDDRPEQLRVGCAADGGRGRPLVRAPDTPVRARPPPRVVGTDPGNRVHRSEGELRARGGVGSTNRGLHRVPHPVTATGSTEGEAG